MHGYKAAACRGGSDVGRIPPRQHVSAYNTPTPCQPSCPGGTLDGRWRQLAVIPSARSYLYMGGAGCMH